MDVRILVPEIADFKIFNQLPDLLFVDQQRRHGHQRF